MSARAASIALLAASTLVTLAGCSSGSDSASPEPVVVTKTVAASSGSPSASPSPTSSVEPYAPNVGKTALRVGETRQGSGLTTRVIQVRRPMTSGNPYIKPDDPSQEWLGVMARQCARDTNKRPTPIGWDEFSGTDRFGSNYPAGNSTWEGFPSPQFPLVGKLSPGQCAAGWVLIPVGKNSKITSVLMGGYGEPPAAQWRL